MAGVEGYVESAALGYLAGVGVARVARGLVPELPPPDTAHGALLRHLQNADAKHFQPMNVNYGLFPPLDRETIELALLGQEEDSENGEGRSRKRGRRRKLPKREKNELLAARALASLGSYRALVRCGNSGAA
jgi:folate-dependent tRNA-U54 methylase TrmFO/GidA